MCFHIFRAVKACCLPEKYQFKSQTDDPMGPELIPTQAGGRKAVSGRRREPRRRPQSNSLQTGEGLPKTSTTVNALVANGKMTTDSTTTSHPNNLPVQCQPYQFQPRSCRNPNDTVNFANDSRLSPTEWICADGTTAHLPTTVTTQPESEQCYLPSQIPSREPKRYPEPGKIFALMFMTTAFIIFVSLRVTALPSSKFFPSNFH